MRTDSVTEQVVTPDKGAYYRYQWEEYGHISARPIFLFYDKLRLLPEVTRPFFSFSQCEPEK